MDAISELITQLASQVRAELDALQTQLERERAAAAAGYQLVTAAHLDWVRRIEAALQIADTEDVTDWQRGWRACADKVREALTPEAVDVQKLIDAHRSRQEQEAVTHG